MARRPAKRRARPRRSAGEQDRFNALLRDRQSDTVLAEMSYAGELPDPDGDRAPKQKWASAFSRALAQKVADALRHDFPGILPSPAGEFHESPARTAKGVKRLDVNYSTSQLGLGLGVSIKTINSRDPKSKRFVKNRTRVDNELRAEAKDYHERQPYAVMIALVFLPIEATTDANPATRTPSSFGSVVEILRYRARRTNPRDEAENFERIFVGYYDNAGQVVLLDVESPPPFSGPPDPTLTQPLTLPQAIREIGTTYARRNNPPFVWAEGREPWTKYGNVDTGVAADEGSDDLT